VARGIRGAPHVGFAARMQILNAIPEKIRAYAQQIIEARGDSAKLGQVMASSPLPIVIVDDQRRYLEVNSSARSALGPSRVELEGLRVDDLTPPYWIPALEANWARLMSTGWIASQLEPGPADASYLGVDFYALANVLPGHHVIAFAVAGRARAQGHAEREGTPLASTLTRRQLEVLGLAAQGRDGPAIAHALTLSPATVRTHFQNIYAKLGVRDRAGAVAEGFRRGLIA
jgi:DNA-binding CsgD family transcriptional regulator